MLFLVLAVTAIYFLLSQAISVYSQYNDWLLWLAWKHRNKRIPRPPAPEEWPSVTVQLPIYNEPEVVERLLRAVAALDYPWDRLQVQLLDDSTDGVTSVLSARVTRELRGRGLEIEEIRRKARTGYKAGALQEALPRVRGEFMLLLDADFLPEPDLLRRLVPWFSDPTIGMVQARWGTVVAPSNMVERSSVHWAERHFGIEQFARCRTGQFFHFNGSGGMWRRVAIEESGGWSAETLAEDLELSYRAWKKGWRFHFDDEVDVPADPPPDMPALRIQQGRWSQGSFQVARRLIPAMGALPLKERFRLFMHVTGYAFSPLILFLALASGPAAWAREELNFWAGFFLIDLFTYLFLIGMAMQLLYRWRTRGPRGGIQELETAVMGLGLSFHILRRAIKGWTTLGGEFERTPKVAGKASASAFEVWPEVTLATAAGLSCFMAISFGAYHLALLPFLAAVGLAACVAQVVLAVGAADERATVTSAAPSMSRSTG